MNASAGCFWLSGYMCTFRGCFFVAVVFFFFLSFDCFFGCWSATHLSLPLRALPALLSLPSTDQPNSLLSFLSFTHYQQQTIPLAPSLSRTAGTSPSACKLRTRATAKWRTAAARRTSATPPSGTLPSCKSRRSARRRRLKLN